jgi:hypothetical protein
MVCLTPHLQVMEMGEPSSFSKVYYLQAAFEAANDSTVSDVQLGGDRLS